MSSIDDGKEKELNKTAEEHVVDISDDQSLPGSIILIEKQDILSSECLDPTLDAKINLVNAAINEIGMTPFQWKMFCLTGFGYFIANMIYIAQAIITGQAAMELLPENQKSRSLTIAVGIGAVVGNILWGLIGDTFGRRWAFNSTLIICSVFTTVSGAAPTWNVLAFFVAMGGVGVGGCWAMDATLLLEFVPRNSQWMVIFLGIWWGKYAITSSFDRAFNLSCHRTRSDHHGLVRVGISSKFQLRICG